MNINSSYNLIRAMNTLHNNGGVNLQSAKGMGSFENVLLSALLNQNNSGSVNNIMNRQFLNSGVKAPETMEGIFEEAANTYSVPLNLLKAVAKAESNFDPAVVSSAGAQGVMQLMPGTAKYLGVADPFDARSNIMGGARYLSEKLKQYDGDVELTLAAYNAGSGNVKKYGGVPPFKETMNYIKKVQMYMGQELTTNQVVQSNLSAGTGVSGGEVSAVMGNDVQTVSYLVDMMRLRMEMQMQSAFNSMYQNNDGLDL